MKIIEAPCFRPLDRRSQNFWSGLKGVLAVFLLAYPTTSHSAGDKSECCSDCRRTCVGIQSQMEGDKASQPVVRGRWGVQVPTYLRQSRLPGFIIQDLCDINKFYKSCWIFQYGSHGAQSSTLNIPCTPIFIANNLQFLLF